MNIELVFTTSNQKCGTNMEISEMFKTIIEETQSEDLVNETYNKIRGLLEEMLILINERERKLMVKNNY